MDKFDIHKWQREALLSESKRFDFHPLHTEERMKAFSVEKKRLVKTYFNKDNGDTLRYVVEHLYDYIVDSQHLNEDIAAEEAGTGREMVKLFSKVLPVAKEFLALVKKKGEVQDLKTVLAAAESELKIDIPDTPKEADGISKSELESIGKAKNLFVKQELGENKDSFEKKVIDLLGGTGVLATIGGTLAKVSNIAGAADITGVGIFFMLVSILLSSYNDSKDENLQKEEVDPSKICPKCEYPFLVSDVFGLYTICFFCGFDSIGN